MFCRGRPIAGTLRVIGPLRTRPLEVNVVLTILFRCDLTPARIRVYVDEVPLDRDVVAIAQDVWELPHRHYQASGDGPIAGLAIELAEELLQRYKGLAG